MGRVGRLDVALVILLLIGIFNVGFVSASNQKYNIEININITNNSNNILLNTNILNIGNLIENPFIFNIDINYINNSNLKCLLTFNDGSYSVPFEINNINFTSENLNSGENMWKINCWDTVNTSNTVEDFGNFDVFDFFINPFDEFYFNGSIINGTVSSQGDYELKLIRGNTEEIINHNDGAFSIEGSLISTPGEYELMATTNYYGEELSISRNFSVGYVSVKFLDEIINLGENAYIKLIINSQGSAGSYFLKSGTSIIDGGIISGSNIINLNLNNFKPNNNGNYSLKLTGQINGKNYNFDGENILIVEKNSNEDNEYPNINLKYPKDGKIISDKNINFLYDVEDNIKIKWCEFNLYNLTITNGVYLWDDSLIYTQRKNDFNDKSETVEIKIVDFDERDYMWEIICEDNNSNQDFKIAEFKINFLHNENDTKGISSVNNYTRKGEIDDLIKNINIFLESESELGIEERKALDILGIGKNMIFYKKQLIQMDQTLKFNLKFMKPEKREKRISEINDEINEIKENIILSIKVEDTYEYSKNSIDTPMFDIITKYFNVINHNVKKNILKKIVGYNKELQKKINTRIKTSKLSIEYMNETREMILINKKISINDDFTDNLLEIIPEDISKEIIFVSDANNLGDGIWEININKLENKELVYYFYNDLPLQKIEKTETLLFNEEGRLETNIITGFVIGINNELSFSFYSFLIGFFLFGYVGFFLFGKVKLELWKKDPAVINILNLIEKTKLQLRQNEVENARENYCKMGEIYKLLPIKSKAFFFNEIKMIRLAIDKKDVLILVKEYERAKSENRREDTIQIHAKIGEIYKKLPKKFQDKVYQRLVKNEIK